MKLSVKETIQALADRSKRILSVVTLRVERDVNGSRTSDSLISVYARLVGGDDKVGVAGETLGRDRKLRLISRQRDDNRAWPGEE